MTLPSFIAEQLRLRRQFLLFATIGGVATFVDMGALWVALRLFHLNPYAGRVFSFLCAATFTWLCNRNITFKGQRSRGLAMEYLRFVGVAAIGGSANYAVYSAVVALTPRLLTLSPEQIGLLPYLGVIIGSGAGLAFNYTGSSKLVFKPPPPPPP